LAAPAAPPPPDPAPYVYGATDIRPRQTREIELCEKASTFDWQYTGAFAIGFGTSIYLNVDRLKHSQSVGLRLLGPALIGFTWGGLLSGGYLSLPKCDPLWADGPPPEGNVRAIWPLATAIAVIAGVTGPIMDYAFLGPVKVQWAVAERSARVLVAATTGILGTLFPYVLPPRTWSARKQIDRMRIEGTPSGASLTYTLQF
jgi:hypothetical protein